MSDTEKVSFKPEALQAAGDLIQGAITRCREVLERDPRWDGWTEHERADHHFVLTMNVVGNLLLNVVHAYASCTPTVEQVNHYLDDWTGFTTEAAARACGADFEIGLFMRVKKHDGECGPRPDEAANPTGGP